MHKIIIAKSMRVIPFFYQIHSPFKSYTLVRIDNTNKIPKTLELKYQIPSWYRFGIGIPKRWYPIDIFRQYIHSNTQKCVLVSHA